MYEPFILLVALRLCFLIWELSIRYSPVSRANAAVPGAGSTASGFTSLIGELTSGFDLTVALQRKNAYNRCYEHAKENFAESEDGNLFLAEAAHTLDQPPVRPAIPISTRPKVACISVARMRPPG